MTHPMIQKDAEELAGQFYEENLRSPKFRMTWKRDLDYVREKWPHFVDQVRKTYAELLKMNHVSDADKELMYEALISEAPAANSAKADTTLQIAKNSQNFTGDKKENVHIADTYGNQSDLKQMLKGSTAIH